MTHKFVPIISDFDLHLFAQGRHLHCYEFLGAHLRTIDGVDGVVFATWAPNASQVKVLGDFNHWSGHEHAMHPRESSGIWELFIPGLENTCIYKFEIHNNQTGEVLTKADPYAQRSEMRPKTASLVTTKNTYTWQDQNWLQKRSENNWLHSPLSIYECHLGSWQRDENNHFLSYQELAHLLVDYVKELGFTHIELLPITEHPLDDSWGYQTTGYFSPTARFGDPDSFRYFVDYCHTNGIGVILDWVPAHFPKDAHGLARFDGTSLYEHEDPRRGEHRDWGTLIYNYGRNEVKNFLIASAIFWLKEYHIDGLRVDAVASMLYLDYSRNDGDWLPNHHGGNENLEAIEFLRELNRATHANFPGSIVLAEESTSWPQVTRPTDVGGLGFSMKWNMGWMHDTLDYFAYDPIYRQHHQNQLTFGLLYLFSENFALPFSHDEVVHGKKSLLYKMPGDEWQRFANLRLLYTLMFTYPGKKLLFMGCEFAQGREWDHHQALDWYVLDYPHHAGIKKIVSDLNHLYCSQPALHVFDFDAQGFEWVSCDDNQNSVLAYLRKSENQKILTILNFTPVVRENYQLYLSDKGKYRVIFNSDSTFYAGTDKGNSNLLETIFESNNNTLSLELPPLGALILEKID